MRADLHTLGGPAAVPLEDMGDGTYRLSASFALGGEGASREVVVFVEQETSLGSHWVKLTRGITVSSVPTAVVEEDPFPPPGLCPLAELPQSLQQRYRDPL